MAVIEKLQYKFGTQVDINQKIDAKGTIEISFFSRDDLNRIIDLLCGV